MASVIRELLENSNGHSSTQFYCGIDLLLNAGVSIDDVRLFSASCDFLSNNLPKMPPQFLEAHIGALLRVYGECAIPALFSKFGDDVEPDVFFPIEDSATFRETAINVLPKFLGFCPKLSLLPEDDVEAEKILRAFFKLRKIPTEECMRERTKAFKEASDSKCKSALEKMMAGACSENEDTEFDLTVGWFASTCSS